MTATPTAATAKPESAQHRLLRLLRTQDERLGLDPQEHRRPCNHRHPMEARPFRPTPGYGLPSAVDLERTHGRPV